MKNMDTFMRTISIIMLSTLLVSGPSLAAEQVYFYYTDPAGTPLAMTDTNGTVVWRADYLPFGEETVGTSTAQNNKMFVGKERDGETGLYYFGARYMDSGSGRFTSVDPKGPIDIGTGKRDEKYIMNPQRLNRYAYAGNNPYKFIDPDGLDWFYSQFSGRFVHVDNISGVVSDYGIRGYSGFGVGLNNSDMQNVKDIGPIVAGTSLLSKII